MTMTQHEQPRSNHPELSPEKVAHALHYLAVLSLFHEEDSQNLLRLAQLHELAEHDFDVPDVPGQRQPNPDA